MRFSIVSAEAMKSEVNMRNSRDAQLAVPKLIVPSVQCNIRAGRFPEPDENLGF